MDQEGTRSRSRAQHTLNITFDLLAKAFAESVAESTCPRPSLRIICHPDDVARIEKLFRDLGIRLDNNGAGDRQLKL
jgi:hypothetical protein